MPRQEAQFSIQEAGCLIYVTDRSVLAGTAGEGPVTGGELYQDDGYEVRVVLGELSDDERDNWTSRLAATVDLPTGEMIVAGILDPDFDRWLEQFGTTSLAPADAGARSQDHELGCVVWLDPGRYAVELYGYPPNDLAGGWMRIEDPRMFREAYGARAAGGVADEPALRYFERTRPGEPVPPWITEGWEDAAFLDFVVRLQRVGDADEQAARSAGQQYLEWDFRKPDVCPVGIRI